MCAVVIRIICRARAARERGAKGQRLARALSQKPRGGRTAIRSRDSGRAALLAILGDAGLT